MLTRGFPGGIARVRVRLGIPATWGMKDNLKKTKSLPGLPGAENRVILRPCVRIARINSISWQVHERAIRKWLIRTNVRNERTRCWLLWQTDRRTAAPIPNSRYSIVECNKNRNIKNISTIRDKQRSRIPHALRVACLAKHSIEN